MSNANRLSSILRRAETLGAPVAKTATGQWAASTDPQEHSLALQSWTKDAAILLAFLEDAQDRRWRMEFDYQPHDGTPDWRAVIRYDTQHRAIRAASTLLEALVLAWVDASEAENRETPKP